MGTLAGIACSSAVPGPPDDAGTSNDASVDAGTRIDATATPFPAQASIVFVDGLVKGAATDTTGTAFQLDDVRVCIFDTNNVAITPYALPDSAPMPFTSYPGVHRGGGVDLGSITKFAVKIEVYSASALAADATWSSNRAAYKCQTMGCDQAPPACQRHVSLPATLQGGVNVIALLDDTSAPGVKLAQKWFEDVTYAGTENSLWGTVMDFSGWHSNLPIAAFYGNYVDGSGVDDVIENPVDPLVTGVPREIVHDITSYDALGIRFDAFSGGQPSDRFGQSLDSIGYVSDATLTPPAFYGVRANFVFALVGDPNDPTSVQTNGGRDPSFDGTGLHIVAVPYATPLPL